MIGLTADQKADINRSVKYKLDKFRNQITPKLLNINSNNIEAFYTNLYTLKLSGISTKPVWQEFFKIAQKYFADHYDEKGENYGLSWRPLSPNYKDWKKEKIAPIPAVADLMLKYHGAKLKGDQRKLRKAVSGGPGWFDTITDKQVTYGVNIKYAAAHQFGNPKKRLPQRPFMGMVDGSISPALVKAMRDMMAKRVSEAYKS